jgi:hypothetical protein
LVPYMRTVYEINEKIPQLRDETVRASTEISGTSQKVPLAQKWPKNLKL